MSDFLARSVGVLAVLVLVRAAGCWPADGTSAEQFWFRQGAYVGMGAFTVGDLGVAFINWFRGEK